MRSGRLAPLLLSLSVAAAADFVPMAVWYGGGKARAPMLEPDARAHAGSWRRDLQQIRQLGFNSIRCWIDWATGEPAEKQYRFDTLDVLLDLAAREGLKVIVQVYMDSAPAWVGRKYPDSLFVSSNGQAVKPESAPGYCFDHPGVRDATLAFLEALGRRAAQSPALLGFDLWSEPHVINWATPTYISNPEFCFCTNTQRRLRSWLRLKYGSLDRLNAAWYRQFESWDEIEPGRLSTILSYTDYIDWKTFVGAKLGEDLRARYEAAKRGAPDCVAVSHAAGVGLFASPHWWEGQSDDWTMAQQVDYYGTSFYPKHSAFVDRDTEWRAALLDFTRSFGFARGRRGFWIGELQSGFGTIALNVSPTVTPEDLRVWTWSALARGAKGICHYAWYPMSSGYESGGFGMIRLDGTVTARARAAGEIARVVDRNRELFAAARPARAEVAIVYNPLSHFVGGRQRATAYGGPQGEVAGIERDSLLGIHRALFPTNVPIDYVHIGELDLAGYKLVFLPYPLMLPARAAEPLREYVRNGGALVAEARLGWSNETGRASDTIPGMGLDELMGCRETEVQTGAKGRTALVWATGEIPNVREGDRIPARWYEESLEPRGDARVAARFENGDPAAVLSRFGKGRTLMLGSYVSAAYQPAPAESAARLYRGLLAWAGVRLPPDAGGAEMKILEAGSERLLFLFNHGREPLEPRLALDGTDLVSGRAVDLRGARLLPAEVKVVRIRVR